MTDGVTLGFRCGADHVSSSPWIATAVVLRADLAMLRMITPALQRLMRTPDAPPARRLTLTGAPRAPAPRHRRSNADIAADLFVSVATVRKHLEHAYRKLGVYNRSPP